MSFAADCILVIRLVGVSTDLLALFLDSEPIQDTTPRPDDATPAPLPSQPPSPSASVPPQQPPSTSHKKGANKKPHKRLGRNQYTKDRDFPPKVVASPHRPKSQPSNALTSSSEEAANMKNSPNPSNDTAGAASKARTSKPKPKNVRQLVAESEDAKEGARDAMTLADMNKSASMMIEYIAKAQIDVATERVPASVLSLDSSETRPPESANTVVQQHPFKDLTSREMMDALTSQIMLWQKEYADTATASTSAVT